MANLIDQQEADGREQFRSRHWMERVKKVRRYPMVKIRNEQTGNEKLERRENFFKGGNAELGLRDKYFGTPWKYVSDHSVGATAYVEETDEGLKPLDQYAIEAYEKNRKEDALRAAEAKAELEQIREEMRAERQKMEKILAENRKRDKAEAKELLGTLGNGTTATRKVKAARKKAAAKKSSTPPVTPPATPVTDVQEPSTSEGGARSI